ncbi:MULTISPECIES: hypothetical protein [Serratia]|uniref:hypothetical protein n=1 Tax=Serratia TaxID=613 RepID=UPI0007451D0C|nr:MULTISPECIES: hypothetical protein [Serratia]MBH3248920.1 hypothetical protein [Serratia marcescens]MBN5282151.1 hypothetical protein [Serratia ureilytica]MBN5373251.1 hypothetical protein [Serratia ureilytica]CUZ07640.1 Uncharacterised protein [Serratia marcescens]CUZ34149.1 Uncharacterised protein [Serratia marcescens]
MSKINSLISLSSLEGIDIETLDSLGVTDVVLNADTALFIDPLLLSESVHPEIRINATEKYNEKFRKIMKYLRASKLKNDAPWKAAKKEFNFSEVSFTCLGYSSTIHGSGWGDQITNSTMDVAKQIIDLGVDDTDFFMGLSLFEEGIGPDRISDMTTNIIFNELLLFTSRINEILKLPTKKFKIKKTNFEFETLINPTNDSPLMLVPNDIVRALPIVTDWSDIGTAARHNDELREKLNYKIGGIWTSMSRQEKNYAKDLALRSKDAFEDVLNLIRSVDKVPYDAKADKNGEFFWREIVRLINQDCPLDLSRYNKENLSEEEFIELVNTIVLEFKDLIENKGIWKELWSEEGKPRKEKAVQRLLFTVAYSYCKANNLDISPESDSGNGPVDFKISKGFNKKIVVEIKLSTNSSLVHGYEKQLEIYKNADDTNLGIFIIMDIGKLGKKFEKTIQARNKFLETNKIASEIIIIDGNQKASASIR